MTMTGRLPVTYADSLLRPSNTTMSLLSLSSAPSPSSTFFAPTSPSPSPPSSSHHFSLHLRLRSTSTRSLTCSCSLHSLKVRAEQRVVMDKDFPENLATSISSSRTFLNARTEQGFLSVFSIAGFRFLFLISWCWKLADGTYYFVEPFNNFFFLMIFCYYLSYFPSIFRFKWIREVGFRSLSTKLMKDEFLPYWFWIEIELWLCWFGLSGIFTTCCQT